MSEKIGRFEIRRLLGEGAQSLVYLAYDPHLERKVAIKRFADSLVVSAKQLRESLDRSIAETVDFSAILHIDLRQTRLGDRADLCGQGEGQSNHHF